MEKFFKWFIIIGRYSSIFLDKQLEKYGLNSSHYPYIMRICSNENITQEYLRKIIHVNPSNITRSLDFLEKNEFIKRYKSATDKRTSNIVPTEKAFKVYKELREAEHIWFNRLLKDFTKEEKENLDNMLQKITLTVLEDFNVRKEHRK